MGTGSGAEHDIAKPDALARLAPAHRRLYNAAPVSRVAFCTFGCRLNQYDTETLRTLLEEQGGWRSVRLEEAADLYVVNTCSVTARADATARKAIRRIHAEHPDARIVVTGCYAQRAPGDIAAIEGVSLVLGAADRGRIAAEVEVAAPDARRIVVAPIETATKFLDVPVTEMMEHSRAVVKVQEGCNEACSFCIVPQTRGRSRSRSPQSVLEQVAELIEAGYVEIVLTGVHLGDFGLDLGAGQRLLVPLVERILELPGLARFRLSSIEPASVSDDLIDLMAAHPRFARHFHIPFQSGSDAVLERMRRRYRAADFVRLARRIAEAVPECGIGADVICGFPGERDEDFQRTFDALVELPVTYLHPFTYSERPGSEAESFSDQVPPEVRKRRTRALKRLGRDKTGAFQARHVGRELSVVVEPSRRAGTTELGGWTDNYLRVELGPGVDFAPVERVRITGVGERGLTGVRLGADTGVSANL